MSLLPLDKIMGFFRKPKKAIIGEKVTVFQLLSNSSNYLDKNVLVVGILYFHQEKREGLNGIVATISHPALELPISIVGGGIAETIWTLIDGMWNILVVFDNDIEEERAIGLFSGKNNVPVAVDGYLKKYEGGIALCAKNVRMQTT